MSDMYFRNLPDTTTPIIDVNLNKLNDVKVSTTEPITGEKIWIKKGKNILNKDTMIDGYRFGSDGLLFSDSSYSASDFIKVLPNTTYTCNWTLETRECVCYYDRNAWFISRNVSDATFTTPADCKYIRISRLTTQKNTAQVELGSTSTTYESFIEDKISIKNDSNIYEEFINASDVVSKSENSNNYSSVEQKIGTWINGEPLYRKVVLYKPTNTIGATNTATNIQIAHNISNFKMCTDARVVTDTANIFPAFNGSSALSSGTTIPMVGETYIYLRIVNDTWSAGKTWYFVLEYIKTTN